MHYPVEMYVKALERLAEMSLYPYDLEGYLSGESKQTPDDYAGTIKYHIVQKRLLKQVIQMLQGTPMSLYTTYPDYFPEPATEPPVAGGGEE